MRVEEWEVWRGRKRDESRRVGSLRGRKRDESRESGKLEGKKEG